MIAFISELPASIMRQYLTIIVALTILSCNNNRTENKQTELQQNAFQESGLRIACTRAIKTLDNEIDGVHYVDNKGKHINKDSINYLLYSISELDDFTQNNSIKYITGLSEFYEKKDKNVSAYKLTITDLLMAQIKLQDFDLYLNDSRKLITIRLLNDYEVIKIKIDSTEIYRLSESIPVGLEKVIYKLDSIKEIQNANR